MKKLALITALLMGLTSGLQAHLLDPVEVPSNGNSSPTQEESIVGTELGYVVEFLWKTPGGAPENPYGLGNVNLFVSDFPENNDDPDADVSWDLTNSGWELRAIAVKAGRGYKIYEVSNDQYLKSDALETILGYQNKGISHISWFGVQGGEIPPVPDGGATIGLFGIALVGLGLLARRRG